MYIYVCVYMYVYTYMVLESELIILRGVSQSRWLTGIEQIITWELWIIGHSEARGLVQILMQKQFVLLNELF